MHTVHDAACDVSFGHINSSDLFQLLRLLRTYHTKRTCNYTLQLFLPPRVSNLAHQIPKECIQHARFCKSAIVMLVTASSNLYIMLMLSQWYRNI